MNNNEFENYYQILGLPDFASIEEVKIKILYVLLIIVILTPIFSFAQNTSTDIIGTLAVPGILRECPSIDCKVIRYYAETAKVKITDIDTSNNWYKVIANDDYGNTIEGWMHYTLFTEDYRDLLKNQNYPKKNEQQNQNQRTFHFSLFYISLIIVGVFFAIVYLLDLLENYLRKHRQIDKYETEEESLKRKMAKVLLVILYLVIWFTFLFSSFVVFGGLYEQFFVKNIEPLTKEESNLFLLIFLVFLFSFSLLMEHFKFLFATIKNIWKKGLLYKMLIILIPVFILGTIWWIQYREKVNQCKTICIYHAGNGIWIFQNQRAFQTLEQCIDYCLIISK
jgi:uncharacterized membrane protein